MKNKVFIITFCLLLGLTTRLVYCIKYSIQPRDAYKYELMVQEWIKTGTPAQLPFFPLSLWIFKSASLFLNIEILTAGIIVNMIAGLLIIYTAINISLYLFKSYMIALFVGASFATHPSLIYYSCTVLRENTYLLFIILFFSSITKYFKEISVLHLLLASLYVSLAFLCRLESIEIVFIFSLYYALYWICRFTKHSIKKITLHYLLFIFVFSSNVFFVYQSLGFRIAKNLLLSKFK